MYATHVELSANDNCCFLSWAIVLLVMPLTAAGVSEYRDSFHLARCLSPPASPPAASFGRLFADALDATLAAIVGTVSGLLTAHGFEAAIYVPAGPLWVRWHSAG